MSHKPQTTRNRILGILTEESAQLVFVDTPGIHKSKNILGETMNKTAAAAIGDADVRILMLSAPEGLTELDKEVISMLRKQPTILVINKADAVAKTDILGITDKANAIFNFTETVPVSAKRGDNLDVLHDLLISLLPNGPRYFPDDALTDMPERQLWSEFIRGKALLHLQDEVPHGIAVEILSGTARDGDTSKPGMLDIEATIICEKETHKGIIIGKGGEMLKRIGTEARRDLERLSGMKVNLKLWVKVRANWRGNRNFVREYLKV